MLAIVDDAVARAGKAMNYLRQCAAGDTSEHASASAAVRAGSVPPAFHCSLIQGDPRTMGR
jgi:hypothetical protein